jgi:hypothetical protein
MLFILGILDILAGVTLVILKFKVFSLAWFFVAYLILKALIFFNPFGSLMDVISAILIVLAIFQIHNFITWLFVLWLLQKGVLSFFS